jgi:hypothetical protein
MAVDVGVETGRSRSAVGFDADRLAYLEVAGWRAYYDHKWVLTFRLLVQLSREQFGLSWGRAVQAAYFITRASVAWAPVDNKPRVALRYIRKFYRLAATYGSNVHFEPRRTADLEFKYWDVHRRLSGRPESEKMPLIRTLAELHSAIFGLPVEAMWQSGVDRAHSTDTVDEITGKRSTDVEGDWRRAEEYLRKAYRDIQAQLP